MMIGTEGETVEFKKSLSQLEKGLRSLTAMLNKNGYGTVYFGVNKDGEVNHKVTVGKSTFAEIRNEARALIEPVPALNISSAETDEGDQYLIVSAEGQEIPYAFDGRFYTRSGTGDDLIPVSELRKLFIRQYLESAGHVSAEMPAGRRTSAAEVQDPGTNGHRLLDYLEQYPDATLQDAAEELGLSLPGIKKIAARLRAQKRLIREGSRKTGRWTVVRF